MPTEATYRLARFPRSRLKRAHLVAEGAEKTLCGQTGGRIIGEARTTMMPESGHMPARLQLSRSVLDDEVCWHCEWLATGWH